MKHKSIEELIKAPPGWIIRNGLLLFFILIVVAISLVSLVTYPQVFKFNIQPSDRYVLYDLGSNDSILLLKDSMLLLKKNDPLYFSMQDKNVKEMVVCPFPGYYFYDSSKGQRKIIISGSMSPVFVTEMNTELASGIRENAVVTVQSDNGFEMTGQVISKKINVTENVAQVFIRIDRNTKKISNGVADLFIHGGTVSISTRKYSLFRLFTERLKMSRKI
jgi:hypothetical protein